MDNPLYCLNRRKHQGVTSVSYMLKKTKTKRITCRNERAIRRFVVTALTTGLAQEVIILTARLARQATPRRLVKNLQ